MKRFTTFSFLAVLLLVAGSGHANVWMDESFDDGLAFAPIGNGDGSLDDGIDLYSFNAITNPLSITATGAISSDRSFNGFNSYLISAGQSVSAATPYQDQANGPFQYFQFAVSLGSIPASPGTMATFRWNWEMDGVNHSFKVDFVSDGSSVNLVAGEDLAGASTATIDTLSNTTDWTWLTVQVQKNATAEDNPRLGLTGVTQGAYFFSSSEIPGVTVPFSGATVIAQDWSISVSDGSIYVDEMYWEGGMTADTTDNEKLRPLDHPPSPVEDWTRY